jgi:triosephosphate isomerase
MVRLLVANWKLNPQTEFEATMLAKAVDAENVVICPPFTFLRAVKRSIKKAELGAQDVFWEEKGAYTGEISPRMLKNLGVTHVILGHSERRSLGESDEMISKKVRAVFAAGLRVILCVGEPASIRRKGLAAAQRFVESQLRRDLEGGSVFKRRANLIVAYEPIWAIGTGKPDNPKETALMAMQIKRLLRQKAIYPQRVIYGGSVTSSNTARIFGYKEIDGALVGGASLKANEFKKIIKITSKFNGN